MTRSVLGLLVVAAVAAACGTPPDEDIADLVLIGGHVIDVVAGETLPDQDVWIVGSRIESVVPTGTRRIPQGTQTVEASGHFLMPGLIDAHVHVDHPDELTLYPAYGVTSAFVLRGVPHHLEWRRQIDAGDRFGPDLYLAGDYLDGYPATMEPMLALKGTESARAAVRRQIDAGYDLIKVYTRLAAEQLTAIVEEAHAQGVCVVGHGGRNYDLEHLLAAGQDNLAHGQDLVRWYLEDYEDEEGVERIIGLLAATDLTVTPNLAFTDALIRQGEDLEAILATVEARRLPPAILQPFRRANNRFVGDADEWLPSVSERFELEKRITQRLHAAGVTLLAGTDASTAAVFPGYSLVSEIELLIEAGLPSADALRTATVHPGGFLERCLGESVRVGRLEPGYEADLLLLDGNPLEEIAALRRVSGVVLDGTWVARDQLDAKLAELESDSVTLGEEVIALEQTLFSGDGAGAREIFDRLHQERPGEILFSQYVPFFVGYGFLYGEEGFNTEPKRLESALALYEMYAETYPDYHSAHYMLALARRANGDSEGARSSLERALVIHPEYVKARAELESLP